MHQPISVDVNWTTRSRASSIPLVGDGTESGVGSRPADAAQLGRAEDGRLGRDDVRGRAPPPTSVDFNHRLKLARALRVRVSCSGWRSCSSCVELPLGRRSRSTAIVMNLLSVGAAYGVLVLCSRAAGELVHVGRPPRPDRRVAAALPVRDPLRPFDGLPRVHPQPDPRGPWAGA